MSDTKSEETVKKKKKPVVSKENNGDEENDADKPAKDVRARKSRGRRNGKSKDNQKKAPKVHF